jgi:hypothetical protein
MTSEEKVAEKTAKQVRQETAITRMQEEGWRYIDSSKECFLLNELPVSEAFLTLKFRASASRRVPLVEKFDHFVDFDIIDKLKLSLTDEELRLSTRVNHSKDGQVSKVTPHLM